MAIEFNLFENIESGVDSWRRAYWNQKNQQDDKVTRWLKNTNSATVEVVLQKEDPAQDRVKQFYDAQRDLARNGLPPQTKEGAYNVSGATVEISEMQLRNMSEFSDQSFQTGQSLSKVQIKANKIYYVKCGHYDNIRAGATSFDKEGFQNNVETTKNDYCFACKCSIARELNPKSDFISFKKTNPDEMVNHPSTAYNELPDKNSIYPFPFGSKIPTTPNMTPTDSLPEGTLANNPLQEGFRDMQKDNTVDYVGNRYLPSGTQDGKSGEKPPQFQQSSSNESRNLLSISWDAVPMTDLNFQDGIGKKETSKNNQFGVNVGDLLQDFLIKQSATKRKDQQDVEAQLKKPFGHNK